MANANVFVDEENWRNMHLSKTNVCFEDICFLATAIGVKIKIIDLSDNVWQVATPSTLPESFTPVCFRNQPRRFQDEPDPLVVAHTARHYLSVMPNNVEPMVEIMQTVFGFTVVKKQKSFGQQPIQQHQIQPQQIQIQSQQIQPQQIQQQPIQPQQIQPQQIQPQQQQPIQQQTPFFVHINEKVQIVCPEPNRCNKLFAATMKEAKKHFQRHHRPPKTMTCLIEGCNQKFTRDYAIGQHLTEHNRNGTLGPADTHCNINLLKKIYMKDFVKEECEFSSFFNCSVPAHVREFIVNDVPEYDESQEPDLNSLLPLPFLPVIEAHYWYLITKKSFFKKIKTNVSIYIQSALFATSFQVHQHAVVALTFIIEFRGTILYFVRVWHKLRQTKRNCVALCGIPSMNKKINATLSTMNTMTTAQFFQTRWPDEKPKNWSNNWKTPDLLNHNIATNLECSTKPHQQCLLSDGYKHNIVEMKTISK